MNIFFESPQRLKIELDGTDLKELGITYDELDYSTARTRNILRELLERIGAQRDFDLSNHRMIIEILPSKDDGCIIFFTTVQSSIARKMRAKGESPVWEFKDADDLMDAVEKLKKHGCDKKISLYLLCGKYRLITTDKVDGVINLILNEYGQRVGAKSAHLHTLEHGKLLSADLFDDLKQRQPL